MDFHRFTWISIVFLWFFMDLRGSGARVLNGLWQPVPPCAALWQRIGSPIRNISGGLEDVVDGWEEGTGRTED